MRPVDVVDPVRLAVVLGHNDRAQQLLGDLLLEASSATASPDRVELVVDGVGSGRNKRKNEVAAVEFQSPAVQARLGRLTTIFKCLGSFLVVINMLLLLVKPTDHVYPYGASII